MSQSLLARAHSTIVICALVAALLVVVLRTSAGVVLPGACNTSASTPASYTATDTACASDSHPVGYRLP